jgi:hypothetical protein
MINQIENKVNKLAGQVIPKEWLTSFLELDLKAKLVGIATFAKMGNDQEVANFALKAINYIEAQ